MEQYVQIRNKSCTESPLGVGETWTGEWDTRQGYPTVAFAVLTDANCTIYIDQSTNGIDVDDSTPFDISANLNETHRLSLEREYYRLRVVNNGAAQNFLRLQTSLGYFQIGSSPLNRAIGRDADAIVTKSLDSELAIASGLFTDYSIVNKYGVNPEIDTGTVPEDVWGGNGVYQGFPDTAPEFLEVFSGSVNDTSAGTGLRTLRVVGLGENWEVQSEDFTLNGTTGVISTKKFRRVHTAFGLTAGSGGVNAGLITVRWQTTTTVVFLNMQIGRNQTNNSGYTVPAGYTAYLKKFYGDITTNNAFNTATGYLWARSFGSIFRARRPFSVSNQTPFITDIYGGLQFTEKSDLIIRCDFVSGNDTIFKAGYDLLLVKNLVA